MVWSHICHNYSKNNVIPRWFYNEQENTLQTARSTKLTDSFALQTLCTVSPQLAYTGGSTCPSPWQTRKAYLTSKFWRTEFRILCVAGRFRLELATLTNAAVFNLRSLNQSRSPSTYSVSFSSVYYNHDTGDDWYWPEESFRSDANVQCIKSLGLLRMDKQCTPCDLMIFSGWRSKYFSDCSYNFIFIQACSGVISPLKEIHTVWTTLSTSELTKSNQMANACTIL